MDPLLSVITDDARRYRGPGSSTRRLFMSHPGFRAVVLFRVQERLTRVTRALPLARLIHTINLALHGIDFVLGAGIGPGLRVEHPVGIVVGAGVRVGADATILQNVTLGERHGDGSGGGHDCPVVGDRVVLGAGCVLIGGIVVGDDVSIGANAVVTSDVPSGSTAVGVPAKVLPGQRGGRSPEPDRHPLPIERDSR